jgi:hypothetical protein
MRTSLTTTQSSYIASRKLLRNSKEVESLTAVRMRIRVGYFGLCSGAYCLELGSQYSVFILEPLQHVAIGWRAFDGRRGFHCGFGSLKYGHSWWSLGVQP